MAEPIHRSFIDPVPVAFAQEQDSEESEAFEEATVSTFPSPYELATPPTPDKLRTEIANCSAALEKIAEEEENKDVHAFAKRHLDKFHDLLREIYAALHEKQKSAEDLSTIAHGQIRKLHDFNRHLHDDRDKIVGELIKKQDHHKVVGWVNAFSSLTVLTTMCVGVISSIFTGGVSNAIWGLQIAALFVSGASQGVQAHIEWDMRKQTAELDQIKHKREGNQSQTDATFALTRASNQAITDVIKVARDTIKNEQKLLRVILSMRGRS